MRFNNYAGRSDVDKELQSELYLAGIDYKVYDFLKDQREVKSGVIGEITPCSDMPRCGWTFRRAWTYWVAEGQGIPPTYAKKLFDSYGDTVRVEGNGCAYDPYKYNKGFAVGLYHVDSLEGLKALADTIKQVAKDAEQFYT